MLRKVLVLTLVFLVGSVGYVSALDARHHSSHGHRAHSHHQVRHSAHRTTHHHSRSAHHSAHTAHHHARTTARG
jgi:hypothetical protein